MITDSISPSAATKFEVLEVEPDSHSPRTTFLDRESPNRPQRPRKCGNVKALQAAVAVLALLCVSLIIALGAIASRSSDDSNSNNGPGGNPDPPNTLQGAVQVSNIMATLKDLEGVAAQHNGSRCVFVLMIVCVVHV